MSTPQAMTPEEMRHTILAAKRYSRVPARIAIDRICEEVARLRKEIEELQGKEIRLHSEKEGRV